MNNQSKIITLDHYGEAILEELSGSHAYGTQKGPTYEELLKMKPEDIAAIKHKISDVDIRGVFLLKKNFLYGFNSVHEFEDPLAEDKKYFSLQKFINLAIECNPNVVEQLFVKPEHILFKNEFGQELLDLRREFLSKNAYGRFGSYAYSQLKRMTTQSGEFKRNEKRQQIIDQAGGYDAKNASHLIRLLLQGIEILTEYDLHTFRPEYKMLLDYRDGKYTLQEVYETADRLFKELQIALENSKIPNVPNVDKINRWMMSVYDRFYGNEVGVAYFPATTLKILPKEYEMVEKTTLCTISNLLVRKMNNAEAMGIAIPYKDWFTGVEKFNEFKFSSTTIEHLYKFIKSVRGCNPRHLDMVYASDEHYLHQHPMTKELMDKMKELPTTKALYHTAKGYATGNLKQMHRWEQLKEQHNEQKELFERLRHKTKEEWEAELQELETQKETLGDSFKVQKDKLIKDYNFWKDNRHIRKLSTYPAVPDKTNTDNASYMTKFSYDTLLAYEIVHTLKMAIELMKTGTMKDSRGHKEELYAIKHGKYKTFEAFHEYVKELQKELDEAKEKSVLTNHNYEELESWVIDFVDRYHLTLESR